MLAEMTYVDRLACILYRLEHKPFTRRDVQRRRTRALRLARALRGRF